MAKNLSALLKALSHGAIFLATCKAVLLLGDVKLANTSLYHSLLIYFNIPNICNKFTSLKSRIALQVARKIAQCDRAINVKYYPSRNIGTIKASTSA